MEHLLICTAALGLVGLLSGYSIILQHSVPGQIYLWANSSLTLISMILLALVMRDPRSQEAKPKTQQC